MDQSIFFVVASAGELACLDSPANQGRKTGTDGRSATSCVLSARLYFPLPLFSQPKAVSMNLPLSKAW